MCLGPQIGAGFTERTRLDEEKLVGSNEELGIQLLGRLKMYDLQLAFTCLVSSLELISFSLSAGSDSHKTLTDSDFLCDLACATDREATGDDLTELKSQRVQLLNTSNAKSCALIELL